MKVEIKELFDLSEIPERIEIYDNKNLSLDLSYFYVVLAIFVIVYHYLR
jgi:hypothetical protein